MEIFFAVNESYTRQLCVAILSIAENNKGCPLNFHILSSNFPKQSRQRVAKICSFYPNTSISYHTPDINRFTHLKLNIAHISIETYFRYIIAEMMPNLDKCLYLDADIVVNGSLHPLWAMDFGDNYCIGVKDSWIERKGYHIPLGYKENELYINAGVILFNLKKIRQDNMIEKLFKNTVELADKISYQDQDIINITFKGHIGEAESIYNFAGDNVKYEESKRKQAVIIHYTGSAKPWHEKCKNKLKNIWRQYAQKEQAMGNNQLINNQIFVCFHKEAPIKQNNVIIPIQVGKKLSPHKLDMIGDDTGDNISAKNPYFCELTATYWIWKNVKADNVGLFHYRRYLNLKNNITQVFENIDNLKKYGLDTYTISNMLKENDIIVPRRSHPIPLNLYDYYAQEHEAADLDKVLDIINHKYPEMYSSVIQTLKHNSTEYFCNMLITSKKFFDAYANWLFDILFELEHQIQNDVLQRTPYQQRVYGFLAERLTTVYIDYMQQTQNIKIKEVPIIFVETDKAKYRKYCFKRIKRKILTAIGLGKKRWNM